MQDVIWHENVEMSCNTANAHACGANIQPVRSRGLIINVDQGMFTVPVCQLQPYNWKQSDRMGLTTPPCDCRMFLPRSVSRSRARHSAITGYETDYFPVTATDKCGNKFMDATSPDYQDWIKSKCS